MCVCVFSWLGWLLCVKWRTMFSTNALWGHHVPAVFRSRKAIERKFSSCLKMIFYIFCAKMLKWLEVWRRTVCAAARLVLNSLMILCVKWSLEQAHLLPSHYNIFPWLQCAVCLLWERSTRREQGSLGTGRPAKREGGEGGEGWGGGGFAREGWAASSRSSKLMKERLRT